MRRVKKDKTYKAYSFYLNGLLVKKLEDEAIKEKRSTSKQLELVLEKYFDDKS